MTRFRTLPFVGLLLGMIALNALLTVHMWIPEYRFLHLLTTTAELLVIFVVLYGFSKLSQKRDGFVSWILGALAAAFFFFSAGEAFTRFWYDQPFVPGTDLRFIPAVLEMVLHIQTDDVVVPIIITVILLAFWLIFRLLGPVTIRSIRRIGPYYLAIPALFLLTSVSIGFSHPFSKLVPTALRTEPTLTTIPVAPADQRQPASFAFIDDADVYLIIVESYGYTLLSNPEHRELITPFYSAYEPKLETGGITMYSNYLDSPTTGGRSWLADSTLWTGVRVTSQQIYDDLVDSEIVNLLQILKDAGYYSVLMAPGTMEADEQWRSFYAFDEFKFRYDLGYEGPFFNLGAMPDQFILKRTAEEAMSPRRDGRSFFASVILVSSHVPFDRVPPYVQDWDSLGDGEIYSSLEMRMFENNWLGGNEYPEGYTESIKYSLTSTFEFLLRYLPDNALAIVVGDHQPRIPVRERGASSSVPIHIMSKRAELAEAFAAFGYTPGIVPRQPLPHRPMELFQDDLLAVFRGIASTPFTP